MLFKFRLLIFSFTLKLENQMLCQKDIFQVCITYVNGVPKIEFQTCTKKTPYNIYGCYCSSLYQCLFSLTFPLYQCLTLNIVQKNFMIDVNCSVDSFKNINYDRISFVYFWYIRKGSC